MAETWTELPGERAKSAPRVRARAAASRPQTSPGAMRDAKHVRPAAGEKMTNPSPTTICSRIDTHSGLLQAFFSCPRKPAPPAGALARVSARAPPLLPLPAPYAQGCRAQWWGSEEKDPSVLQPPRAGPSPALRLHSLCVGLRMRPFSRLRT